jgi:hypothetical protein
MTGLLGTLHTVVNSVVLLDQCRTCCNGMQVRDAYVTGICSAMKTYEHMSCAVDTRGVALRTVFDSLR